MTLTRILFPLGRIVATPGALQALSQAKRSAAAFLKRHQEGEWGDVSPESKAANTLALLTGERVLSAHQIAEGMTLWIVTEADRSSTCLLLPEEY